jgi:hypothetical protein
MGASTPPIINASESTPNLTPRQSHINLHHLPISYPDEPEQPELPVASFAPQSPGSESDDLLSRSLEGLERVYTIRVTGTSCENDGGSNNSDGDDLDERGYLKVPEYDVCMGYGRILKVD